MFYSGFVCSSGLRSFFDLCSSRGQSKAEWSQCGQQVRLNTSDTSGPHFPSETASVFLLCVSRQRLRLWLCAGVWAAHRPGLPLDQLLPGGGVWPSGSVSVVRGVRPEEHPAPDLRHRHPGLRSAASAWKRFWDRVPLWMCLVSWRHGGGPMVLGGQRPVCGVCDGGTTELSFATTNPGVQVSFAFHFMIRILSFLRDITAEVKILSFYVFY